MKAANELLPIVCVEFRIQTVQTLARARPGQTLRTGSLMHAAYMRLGGAGGRYSHGLFARFRQQISFGTSDRLIVLDCTHSRR